MKKTIFIFLYILSINNYLLSQQSIYDSYTIDNTGMAIRDLCFINCNTGYATATKVNGTVWDGYLFKTTNGGVNWTNIYSPNFVNATYGGRLAVGFSNSVTGLLIKQYSASYGTQRVWGTTNGSSFTDFGINSIWDYEYDPVISGVQIGINYNFFVIRKGRPSVLGIYNLTNYNYDLPPIFWTHRRA
jgi:hypothetical protein